MAWVGTLTYRGQRMLAIDVHDRDALLGQQGPMKRGPMRTNARLVGAVVNIPQSALPLDLDEVVAEVRTFLPPG